MESSDGVVSGRNGQRALIWKRRRCTSIEWIVVIIAVTITPPISTVQSPRRPSFKNPTVRNRNVNTALLLLSYTPSDLSLNPNRKTLSCKNQTPQPTFLSLSLSRTPLNFLCLQRNGNRVEKIQWLWWTILVAWLTRPTSSRRLGSTTSSTASPRRRRARRSYGSIPPSPTPLLVRFLDPNFPLLRIVSLD